MLHQPVPVESDQLSNASGAASNRLWLVLITFLVVLTGMAYSLWWPAVVRHHSWYWLEPGDIWGAVRAAHWIGWGAFSYIYSSSTALVTLPGFHILLTPFVLASSALGLSETAPGFLPVAKPTAWLLIGPVTLCCSAVALFAFDALARQVGLSKGRRKVLALLEGAAIWQTLAIWGHPEDVVALGLAVFSIVELQKRHVAAAGWLLGAAVAMQLYVIALVPLTLAAAGVRRSLPLLSRASIFPGSVFLSVLIPNPHDTLHAVTDQPNYPRIDFPTPWASMAPKLAHGAVAAGPGRLIGLAVAIGIGLLAARYRDNPLMTAWLAGAALATRCIFESVIDPYYLVPVIAVMVLVSARARKATWLLTSLAGAALTVLTYYRPGPWPYWCEMTGTLLVMSALAFPSRSLRIHSVRQRVRRPDGWAGTATEHGDRLLPLASGRDFAVGPS